MRKDCEQSDFGVVLLFSVIIMVPFILEPPKAKKIPYTLEKHGDVRVDDYYWLRERTNPKVLKYLKDENLYTAAALKPTEKLQSRVFAEMKSRIKEDDSSVPFKYGDYYYYKRYEKGFEYPIYARKQGTLDAKEEIILNVNEVAKGTAFCQVRFPAIRPDHKVIAFAVDTKGRRFYTIYFKNLPTGKLYAEKLPDTTGNMAWANDNKTLFYVKQDTGTLRWNRVLRHELGFRKNPEVYFEADETFELSISKSNTDKYIFIRTGATMSTEYRLIDADKPGAEPVMFYPRQPRLEYDVQDGGGVFYVSNNDNARNFKLSAAPAAKTGKENWTDLVAHREDVLLEGVEVFENWLVLKEKDALDQLRVISRGTGEPDRL